MPPETIAATPPRLAPAVHLLLAVVSGLAVVGFFVGIGDMSAPPEDAVALADRPAPAADGLVGPALSYRELPGAARGPNRGWTHRLDGLLPPPVDPFAVPPPSRPAKLRTLQEREHRRAYNGAPPVVPHRVDGQTDAACLVCHEQGLQLGDRVAARMPHPLLASCTQCHVPQDPSGPGTAPPVANGFRGLPAPTEGARAWPGAPPTIPHSTRMRTDCLSCHGAIVTGGMQTTHPWRQSCTQCHAPSAVLDQQPVAPAGPPVKAIGR